MLQKPPMNDRQTLPILAVVFHSRLRERGLFELMQVARVVAITLPDSPAHRFADYSCPVSTLDLSVDELIKILQQLDQRGLRVEGILSLRDGNVLNVALAAERLGLPTIGADNLVPCSDKALFRKRLLENENII